MAQAKNPTKRTRGKLIVISGPSGVGKSTITKAVISRLQDAYLSISMTTRPQAPPEQAPRRGHHIAAEQGQEVAHPATCRRRALKACMRFSAWSKMRLRSWSATPSVTSSPRWAGRQWRKMAVGAASENSRSSTR